MQIEQKELYTSAPLGRRFLAFFLDGLIAGLVLFILMGFLLAVMLYTMLYLEWPLLQSILENVTETTFTLYMLAMFLSFVWFAYYWLLDSFKNGQSWGKRLLGLRVVELESNRPCSRRSSFTRNFLGLSLAFIALFLLPVIGWLLFFVEPYAVISSKEGQPFGDRWARTQVILISGNEQNKTGE